MNEHSSARGEDSSDDNGSERRPNNETGKEREESVGPPSNDQIVQSRPRLWLRYLRDLFIAGGLACGLWVIGEQLRDQGYVRSAHVVNFFASTVFFLVFPIEAVKHWKKPLYIWPAFVLFIVGPTAFVFLGLRPQAEAAPPRVQPSRIHLATDKETIRNAVLVSNPGDLPSYDVTVRVAIEQKGIPADSLIIEPDAPLPHKSPSRTGSIFSVLMHTTRR
jgi:hypothetical protein